MKRKVTLEDITNYMVEALQGGALFTSTGGARDARAGSGPWSSAMDQMTDEDEEGQGLWQNQLGNMNWQYKK